MKVVFLSSNPGKIKAALYALGPHGLELVPTSPSVPEIQADRSVDIASFAAEYHVKAFGLPVVREDHALYINALGIPGPYTSFVERRLSARRLNDLLRHQTDRSGYFSRYGARPA